MLFFAFPRKLLALFTTTHHLQRFIKNLLLRLGVSGEFRLQLIKKSRQLTMLMILKSLFDLRKEILHMTMVFL
ncbi:hypothetical protein D3C86_1841410 [compost metagenome]